MRSGAIRTIYMILVYNGFGSGRSRNDAKGFSLNFESFHVYKVKCSKMS